MPIAAELLENEYDRLVAEAAEGVVARVGKMPEILVVAGSGLGAFAGRLEGAQSAGYENFRHFPQSTVVGHAGKLVWGTVHGRGVLVMAGRKHLYEGVAVREATLPLVALVRAGVRIVILSNAAGGLDKTFTPGDLMLINDHINNQFQNPLVGRNHGDGPRFPDMSAPYDPELMALARACALQEGIDLKEGTYIANTGPTYETQAEVGMLRMMGNAVGMSTVPEAIAAIHGGARVLGISMITNSLVLRTDAKTTHEEVMEVGIAGGDKFCRLVEAIVARLG
jgi:purine-nucleoside phosphorylase